MTWYLQHALTSCYFNDEYRHATHRWIVVRQPAFHTFVRTYQSHYWERDLVRIFGNIHFLTNDPTWIGGIKFYKIVRQYVHRR